MNVGPNLVFASRKLSTVYKILQTRFCLEIPLESEKQQLFSVSLRNGAYRLLHEKCENGGTPLHWAVMQRLVKVAKLILSYDGRKGSVRLEGSGGLSPMDMATASQCKEMEDLLIKAERVLM